MKTDLDETIADLAKTCDKRTLAIWAADCAERVLPHFEAQYPADDRPRKAINALRKWIDNGVFKMADVRKASLDAHAAARQADADGHVVARAAARAAGQAMATAHAKMHAVAAAVYAATVIHDLPDTNTTVDDERDWQYNHLLNLTNNA